MIDLMKVFFIRNVSQELNAVVTMIRYGKMMIRGEITGLKTKAEIKLRC